MTGCRFIALAIPLIIPVVKYRLSYDCDIQPKILKLPTYELEICKKV
jgi:hypothetical protein